MHPTNDFDTRAKAWDQDPQRVERAQIVADAIRASVPILPNMTAFEYGCGTGLLSFALQPDLAQITLADSSPGMLEVLREKIAHQHVTNMIPLQLDLSVDPLPQKRYNLIYTLMTLHHITDTRGMLQNFHALVTTPGWLCIADLDKEDGSFHTGNFTGHHGFDRQELSSMLEQAGFERIHFQTVCLFSKETERGRKTYPLFLVVAEKHRDETM